jgi:hypothetical protein
MNLVVVGLNGKAGSGKDTVADALVAERGFTKMSFAEPCYRITKLLTAMNQGDLAAPFELFSLILDLFGGPTKSPSLDVVTHVVLNDLPFLAKEHDLYTDMANNKKPRKFLQQMATEYFRAYNENIWADYLVRSLMNKLRAEIEEKMNRIEQIELDESSRTSSKTDYLYQYVISDVRFENEIESLRRVCEIASKTISGMNASSYIIKLKIDEKDASDRIAQRDLLDATTAVSTFNHSSEGDIDDRFFTNIINANIDKNFTINSVMNVIDGRSSSSSLLLTGGVSNNKTGLIDLSMYKKGT